MKYRIAGWASAGFLVAGCWALYFAGASKDNPTEPIVYTLAFLTQPIVLASFHSTSALVSIGFFLRILLRMRWPV